MEGGNPDSACPNVSPNNGNTVTERESKAPNVSVTVTKPILLKPATGGEKSNKETGTAGRTKSTTGSKKSLPKQKSKAKMPKTAPRSQRNNECLQTEPNVRPNVTNSNVMRRPPANDPSLTNETENVHSRLDRLENLLSQVIQAIPKQGDKALEPQATRPAMPDAHAQEYDEESLPADLDEAMDYETVDFEIEGDETTSNIGLPAIAAKFAVPSNVGEPVDEEIAKSVTYMLEHKLETQALEDSAARYPPPSNCILVDSPKVNPSVWDNVSTAAKTSDLKLQKIQKSLIRGLNAFMRTLSSDSISEPEQDTLALLCNANFELNCLRKDLIKPYLSARYTHLCKPSNPVTKFLFGDDLSKQVKELKDEQKATAGFMKSRGNFSRQRLQSHPYRGYRPSSRGTYTKHAYRDAGWVSRSSAGTSSNSSFTTNRAFLGQSQGRRAHPPRIGAPPPLAKDKSYQKQPQPQAQRKH